VRVVGCEDNDDISRLERLDCRLVCDGVGCVNKYERVADFIEYDWGMLLAA
jgi:hypothetical protein